MADRPGYFERRRIQAELIVIGALFDGRLTGQALMRVTGLRPGRLYSTLERLDDECRIVSDWIDGPYPRRLVYRLVGA